MPDFISATLIGKRGDLIDTRALKKEVARVNQKMGKRMKRSFEKTTKTFEETEVTFHQKTSTADQTVTVYTENEIYGYLDEGTPIRYAVMSEDFSPKTRPGELDSRPGSGRMVRIDLSNPREGIEAREFSKQVEEKHSPEYIAEIDDIIESATRKNA
jgi:hypothetical protein